MLITAGPVWDPRSQAARDGVRTARSSVCCAARRRPLYDFPTLPGQARLRPGHGPVLVLPRLAPDGVSSAVAVSDDQRVGGAATDATGTIRPVIWTCAPQQASAP